MGKLPRLGIRAKSLIQSKEELFGHVGRALEFFRKNGRKKRDSDTPSKESVWRKP